MYDLKIPSQISPTLAEFLDVPYHTRMYEEDIILRIWEYIMDKNLLIDNRLLMLDKNLKPVIHPHFYYRGMEETEDSFVMIYIAKMHTDTEFIERDIRDRMERIKRSIAAGKIQNWYRKMKNNQNNGDNGHLWMTYLANHYGGGTHCTR